MSHYYSKFWSSTGSRIPRDTQWHRPTLISLSCSLTCMCTQLIVVSKLHTPICTYDILIQLLEQQVRVCLYLSNVIFILLMYVCVSHWR